MSDQEIVVSAPAGSDFLHVIRTVVAGVAARLDFSYDGIEDLKLAVDEACSHLLRAAPAARSLLVRVSVGDAELDVTVSADDESASWPPEELEGSLAWQVLKALTEDPTFEPGADGPQIRFALHR